MVSAKSVEDQLKKIKFNTHSWNHAETQELSAILLPDEEIFECVNGWYEGGFALLCATDIRILLVDKKPLNFLTVEDLRFDTINQIDYSHRMLDASIHVSAGMKLLRFRSFNQPRLRKLIGHVQNRMAEIKMEQSSHTQSQHEHLEQIDQQLQTYLLAQYQQHESMRRQMAESGTPSEVSPTLARSFTTNPLTTSTMAMSQGYGDRPADQYPSSGRADWLYSSSTSTTSPSKSAYPSGDGVSTDELYNEGVKEVFGKHQMPAGSLEEGNLAAPQAAASPEASTSSPIPDSLLEINPLRIAYSKLPMVLRNRQFGRASLPHSNGAKPTYGPTPSAATV